MNLNPTRYAIHLEPDLAKFSFSGRVMISLQAREPAAEVVLHLLDLAVFNCKLKTGEDWQACLFTVDPEQQELLIRLPGPRAGEIILEIEYCGRINEAMAGFYRSRYWYQGETRYLAVTQFQESDARRAFPCIDQPAAKASFDLELTIPAHLVAIANTAVQSEEALADGRKHITFARTPRMSTYLVCWAVGEFEFLEDSIDSRVRAVTLPGMRQHAGFGLALGRQGLAYCEEYYAIPYPLPKLDLLAIPDFAFGAMENWGAITFRENLLLHYPGITSKAAEVRIFEVISHEIAHQWFGNLVTPVDWKYIWLNESFATLFGYGVIDHYRPQWDTWEQFLISTTAVAMDRDGCTENFAIELPGAAEVVINTSTAPIIYSKGGSILRQIRGYIGEDAFREGVRRYLLTHSYDCAESGHLWTAFEEAASQPVAAIMESWVRQPGLPLVTAVREKNSLVLQQKRFTCLAGEHNQRWLIPITISLFNEAGETGRQRVLLDKPEDTVAIPAGTLAYKINAGQSGFFRVQYLDPENLDRLGVMVAAKTLMPPDRWGLQNDLFALVQAGLVRLVDYLAFLAHYQEEEAYLPAAGIATSLAHAYRVVGEELRRTIEAWAIPWLERLLAHIGYEPRAEERFTTSILRDRLLGDAVLYGSEEAAEFSARQFDLLRRGAAVHQDILRSVMLAGAWGGGSEVHEWFVERLKNAGAEHERLDLLAALGFFRGRSEVEKTLGYVLAEVPARNKFVPVAALAANPFAAPLLWGWFTQNQTAIESFHPIIFERVLAALIPAAGLIKPEVVRGFFAEYLTRTDKAGDVIRLSLERLAINLQMREGQPPHLLRPSSG